MKTGSSTAFTMAEVSVSVMDFAGMPYPRSARLNTSVPACNGKPMPMMRRYVAPSSRVRPSAPIMASIGSAPSSVMSMNASPMPIPMRSAVAVMLRARSTSRWPV